MSEQNQIYNLKIDASGRIAIPAEARQRRRLSTGDTVVVIEDDAGLHIKTRAQILAEVQAYFADLAPAGVSLSEEVLADRRAEPERDT